MAFTLNLVLQAKDGTTEQAWDLNQTPAVTFSTSTKALQATFLPGDDEESDSYTLTLQEDGTAPSLPPFSGDMDYQFYVDHETPTGAVDESFMADKPHSRSITLTTTQLTAQLSILPPVDSFTNRAHLVLKDS